MIPQCLIYEIGEESLFASEKAMRIVISFLLNIIQNIDYIVLIFLVGVMGASEGWGCASLPICYMLPRDVIMPRKKRNAAPGFDQ